MDFDNVKLICRCPANQQAHDHLHKLVKGKFGNEKAHYQPIQQLSHQVKYTNKFALLKAMKSVRQFPLPIDSLEIAMSLNGVGKVLAQEILKFVDSDSPSTTTTCSSVEPLTKEANKENINNQRKTKASDFSIEPINKLKNAQGYLPEPYKLPWFVLLSGHHIPGAISRESVEKFMIDITASANIETDVSKMKDSWSYTMKVLKSKGLITATSSLRSGCGIDLTSQGSELAAYLYSEYQKRSQHLPAPTKRGPEPDLPAHQSNETTPRAIRPCQKPTPGFAFYQASESSLCEGKPTISPTMEIATGVSSSSLALRDQEFIPFRERLNKLCSERDDLERRSYLSTDCQAERLHSSQPQHLTPSLPQYSESRSVLTDIVDRASANAEIEAQRSWILGTRTTEQTAYWGSSSNGLSYMEEKQDCMKELEEDCGALDTQQDQDVIDLTQGWSSSQFNDDCLHSGLSQLQEQLTLEDQDPLSPAPQDSFLSEPLSPDNFTSLHWEPLPPDSDQPSPGQGGPPIPLNTNEPDRLEKVITRSVSLFDDSCTSMSLFERLRAKESQINIQNSPYISHPVHSGDSSPKSVPKIMNAPTSFPSATGLSDALYLSTKTSIPPNRIPNRQVMSRKEVSSTPIQIERWTCPLPQPLDWEILLLIDKRERSSALMQSILLSKGIPCELDTLVVGDFLWVARPRKTRPDGHMDPKEEELQVEAVFHATDFLYNDASMHKHRYGKRFFLLDCIVERKSVSDLVSSLCDGRYREQKHRLKNCGVRSVMYLVEGEQLAVPNQLKTISVSHLKTAMISSHVDYKMHVLRTRNLDHTITTLCSIHSQIKRRFHLGKCGPEYQPYLNFQDMNGKKVATTMRSLLGYQLRQIHGCSKEVASAVMKEFGTTARLMQQIQIMGAEPFQRFVADLARDTGEEEDPSTHGVPKTKKVGPKLAQKIYEIYGEHY